MSDGPNLIEQVEQSIAARGLFGRGESILVAVSGGLDSMVLLHLLARGAEPQGGRLTVAHFNHQLRGRSSDADERLVERTATRLGLPMVAGRADVQEFGRKHGLSLEMAARKLRHGFLARAAAKRRIGKIALAHHADDQVELFFVRLLRGAGGEGAAGMKWLAPSPIDARILLVRPFLDQPKEALAAYARRERVAFREDASNRQTDIQRNRIRHELLPLLMKNYQPALARAVLRQMQITRAEAEFVTAAAQSWLAAEPRTPFAALALAVQRRCLQLQLTQQGIESSFQLIEQLRESVNRRVSINEQAVAMRDSAGLVSVQKSANCDFNCGIVNLSLIGESGEIPFGNANILWERVVAPGGTFRAPKRQVNCECFDADKVGADIVLRHWQPGDRFQPIGMNGPVKLQNYFTNEKIDRDQRRQLLVAATSKGELFWVEGLRLGERFKLDKKTRYQLNWRWKRLCWARFVT